MTTTLYESAGGADGMLALATAWHHRCLADPIVSHAFSHPGQNPDHLARLAAYWGEALGGPTVYTDTMGDETFVTRMHAGEGVHVEMDDRAIACFEGAVRDVGLDADPALARTLIDYFAWSTRRLAGYPDTADDVPDGLALPTWPEAGPE